MEIIKISLILILSFLWGAVPTAYIITKKLKDVDLRQVGSKNVGATNASRILGKKWFFIITILDILKGAVPVLFVKYLLKLEMIPEHQIILPLVSIAAIIGHTFPPYLKFQGGKGVNVSAGTIIAINIKFIALPLSIFILVVFLTRYISLGSILGGIALPVSVIIFSKFSEPYILIFFSLIAVYILLKHKSNIQRLVNGSERKWGEKIR